MRLYLLLLLTDIVSRLYAVFLCRHRVENSSKLYLENGSRRVARSKV